MSSMNRFNSDRSVYYSSDKIDNISEASHNSSFTTPSSTSFNSSTKLNGSANSQNANNLNNNNNSGSSSNNSGNYTTMEGLIKPTNLELNTDTFYQNNKNSDSSSVDNDYGKDIVDSRNFKAFTELDINVKGIL